VFIVNRLTPGQTLRSPTRREALAEPIDLARDLAREAQDWLRREGLCGTFPYGPPYSFGPSCCTPQGQEGLAGTVAPSYGSEGWGFESLRARGKRRRSEAISGHCHTRPCPLSQETQQAVGEGVRPVKDRPNTWELRIYLGRDPEGRVRHRHATFHGTRRPAERELARLMAEQDAKPAAVPTQARRWNDTTTVNDAIEAWRDNGWDDLSPKTARHYESIWQVHIKPAIGRRRIASLGTYDVERYYRSLKSAGLSAATVYQVKAVLHRSCRLAQKWSGGTLPNPAADADLPVWRLDERRPEVRAPEVHEVLALLAAAEAEDPRLSCFLRVLAATGMRRGEACALRWSDVDLKAGSVRVDESVTAAKGGALIKGPKTQASIRQVALDDATLNALVELRRTQKRLAMDCDAALPEDGFLFSTSAHASIPPHPDAVSHAFDRLRAKAAVSSDVHLHSLRHFHATALDPVISEAQKQTRLGWSTVQMARHYTDGLVAEDRRAAEHIGRLLGVSIRPRS
jgi:integrase